MKTRSFLLAILLLGSAGAVSPVAAQALVETLDPGPMPAATGPKPVPTDWRRDPPPGDVGAQIAELSKHRPPTAANQARLRQLRALLRPALPPPPADLALRRAYEQRLAGARARRRGRGKRGHGFSIQSLGSPVPDQEFLQVKASPVYCHNWALEAGHEYTLETRNLSAGGDTVLYVARDGQQLAFNDDRGENDPSSLVHFTPDQTGDYTIIIRAYDDAWAGTCDLWIDGQVRQQGIQFAGAVVHWSWKPGDQFQSAHLPSTYARPVDTVQFAFDGLKLVGWNDDGGVAGCSLLKLTTPSTSDSSHVLVAS